MKIIDDEGKLFGRINIIDFAVLVFLFSLTPMIYYGWKLAKAPKTRAPINWEQKYKENDQQWQEKYNAEIAQKERIFKKHPRLHKYFQ